MKRTKNANSQSERNLTPLQKAAVVIEKLNSKVADLEKHFTEPIAVVGIGCRYPGGVHSPESFWQFLAAGKEGVTEIPRNRWDWETYYEPDRDKGGKTMYTRHGGFIDDADNFDSDFFGMSSAEAQCIDPQHRVLLETGWEALEDAGIALEQLQQTRTGVYVGLMMQDFNHVKPTEDHELSTFRAIGTGISFPAARLSYHLGLRGPCSVVGGECASSLLALHMAFWALRNRECDVALAGGVNLILLPSAHIILCRMHALSEDGRCKAFDASADGYGRAEGCGIVVLKRLSDALQQHDRILALLRGSAINHVGRGSGITVPNGPSQEDVIRQALASAALSPDDVSYLEAHGTGTLLGDPIEMGASGGVFGSSHTKADPLIVGSVKTNFAHTEAAAGVAGLIKVVLSLQHQQIPAHLHFQKPSPHIPWDKLPVHVPVQMMPWEPRKGRRVAGVNSFALSGIEAHLICEEAPRVNAPVNPVDRPRHVLTLSAKTPEALEALCDRYVARLSEPSDKQVLADVCFTANCGRSHFDHRLALVASTPEEARDKLKTYRAEGKAEGLWHRQKAAERTAEVGFLFTGQGSQYAGMGRALYETQPTFRKMLDRCDEIVRSTLKTPLVSALYASDGKLLDQTLYTQVSLFSLEYALCELWRSWGVEPSVVLGHSIGEYVAAVVAHVLDLESGLKLVTARARLMESVRGSGQMVAVFAEEPRVRALLEKYAERVSMAAVNAPAQVVVSGYKDAVSGLIRVLEAEGVRYQPLVVSGAFHSPLMEEVLPAFQEACDQVTFARPDRRFISNLHGRVVQEEVTHSEYWVQHLRRTVRFHDGIRAALDTGCRVFLEIGPQPILTTLGQQSVGDVSALWLTSLRRGDDDWARLLESLAQLYTCGVTIDWPGFDRDYSRQKVALPTYPWQRQHYPWPKDSADDALNMSESGVTPSVRVHPLLGRRLDLASTKSVLFENNVSTNAPLFLRDHTVFGTAVFPGAGYIEMALAAGDGENDSSRAVVIENLYFHQPLIVPARPAKRLQSVLIPQGLNAFRFEVFSRPAKAEDGSKWLLHSSGEVAPAGNRPPASDVDLATARQRCTTALSVDQCYEMSKMVSLEYGPRFRGMTQLWCGQPGEYLGQIRLPQMLAQESQEYHFHPVLLDACLHVLLGGLLAPQPHGLKEEHSALLPVSIDRLSLYRRPTDEVWSYARLRQQDSGEVGESADLHIFDRDGGLIACLEGLRFSRVGDEAMRSSLESKVSEEFYGLEWREKTLGAAPASDPGVGDWLVLSDRAGVAKALTRILRDAGGRCICVQPGSAYENLSDDCYTVNPDEAGDFDKVLEDALGGEKPPLAGVLHLWGLDGAFAPSDGSETLEQRQRLLCGGALQMIQAWIRRAAAKAPWLCLVTQQGQCVLSEAENVDLSQAPLGGLGKVLALEYPEFHCLCLDMDREEPAAVAEKILRELKQPDGENRVAYRRNKRYAARVVKQRLSDRLETPLGQPHKLGIQKYGDLSNLEFRPIHRETPGANEVEVEVRAGGLNFRDVLRALGLLQEFEKAAGLHYQAQDVGFGMECTGVVTALGDRVTGLSRGDEVYALYPGGCFASHIMVDAHLVCLKPKTLTFEEAATVPVAFLSAYFALCQLARLKAGERVLIHAAAGGVGQAAVQIAKWVGAEIYATASPSKWDFLKSQGIEHVMNSRTLDFADEVRKQTKGEGVNVILNSLGGEAIEKNLDILARWGRLIELGKVGILEPQQVALKRKDVSYYLFDLVEEEIARPGFLCSMLRELGGLFDQKQFQPLHHRVFAASDAIRAFRFMAQTKHIGKVVLSDFAIRRAGAPAARSWAPAEPQGTYLITGGFGGLGLQVATWLAERGARHLMLMGRSGPASEEAKAVLQQLADKGVQVYIGAADVANKAALAGALNDAEASLPPLRGVVHAAGVLDDAMIPQLTWDRFQRVLSPKVLGAWNLHVLTREMPLDFFVLFSSASSLFGSVGQANYVAANDFLDTLARWRRGQGLPAVSINWGPWASVGMAANMEGQWRRWADIGIRPIAAQRATAFLGELLRENDTAQIGIVPMNRAKFLRAYPGNRKLIEELSDGEQKHGKNVELLNKLRVASEEERIDLMMDYVKTTLSQFGADASKLTRTAGLEEIGIDSLAVVEFRNRVIAELDIEMPATKMVAVRNLEHLAGLALEQMGYTVTAIKTAETVQYEEGEI